MRLSRPQHCWDQLGFWEEFWKTEESCCHLDFDRKQPVPAGVKNLKKMNMVLAVNKVDIFLLRLSILSSSTWRDFNVYDIKLAK